MPMTGESYKLPPGYVGTSGKTILTSQHNPILADIEAAINTTEKNATNAEQLTGTSTTKRSTPASVASAEVLRNGFQNAVIDLGVPNDGTDCTTELLAAFNTQEPLFFPDGDYLIPFQGAATDGIVFSLTQDFHMWCDPRATFKSDAASKLDGSMFLLTCPDSGVPADGVDVKIEGGVFDATNIKNSTTVPHDTNYPPTDVGTAASTNLIVVDGVHTSDTKQGVRRVFIDGVTMLSGAHWESAGGDAHLVLRADSIKVRDSHFTAARDLACYINSDNAGNNLTKNAEFIGNTVINCMAGASTKRGVARFTVVGNDFDNSINAVGVGAIINTIAKAFVGVGNNFNQCTFPFDIGNTNGVTIVGNTMLSMGALLEDSSVPSLSLLHKPIAFDLNGVNGGIIGGNVVKGYTTGFTQSNVTGIRFKSEDAGAGDVLVSNVLVAPNKFDDIGTSLTIEDPTINDIHKQAVSNCSIGNTGKIVSLSDFALYSVTSTTDFSTLTIPADSLVFGDVVDIEWSGDGNSSPSFTPEVFITDNGGVPVTQTFTGPATTGGGDWSCHMRIVVRTAAVMAITIKFENDDASDTAVVCARDVALDRTTAIDITSRVSTYVSGNARQHYFTIQKMEKAPLTG